MLNDEEKRSNYPPAPMREPKPGKVEPRPIRTPDPNKTPPPKQSKE